jgi:protein-disulfide isomerase
MTEPKKENGANLPLIGLGLILAAGAGVAVGWYAHKPGTVPEKKAAATAPADRTAMPGSPAGAEADRGAPESAAAGGSPTTATAGTTPAVSGPCGEYASKICAAAGGDQSADCQAVKKVTAMMPASACTAALGDMGSALAKLEEAKKACVELQTRLCRDIGEDTESCKMVKEQTPRFPPDRCQSMLGQYDNVLKDLQRMEAEKKPLPPEIVAKLTEGSPASWGPADAKVTVVEFSDFLCPYCKFAGETVEKIRPRYEGVVHFVFRQFPLPMHGANARLAHNAALAALAQGKFWQMHDLLFANQDKVRTEGRPAVESLAEQAGLNMAQFRAALDGNTFDAQITADVSLGESAFVNGTPSLFLDGQRMNVDPRDPASVSQAINDALTKAGVPVPPAPPGSEAETPAAPPAPPPPAARPAPLPRPVPPAPPAPAAPPPAVVQ